MKNNIVESIDNMLTLIYDCPELFHDGIDEDITILLKQIKKYIESEDK